MRENEIIELKDLAFKCRNHIIDLSVRGGCFIGASLSCVDLIAYLYNQFLDINLKNISTNDRDRFILSKGHDVPALYSVFVELGLMDKNRLKNHASVDDSIYWHPNKSIQGIDFHSGSLGHGLSIGVGMSYYSKLNSLNNKVVVMLGDGELNEGSIWESFAIANAYNLSNLIAVVDRNNLQANVRTEDLIPLEPLSEKLEAFGWNVYNCDGHDFVDINQIFTNIILSKSKKPSIVIAHTLRGKGLPSIEDDPKRWFVHFTKDEASMLKKELAGGKKTIFTSEELLIR